MSAVLWAVRVLDAAAMVAVGVMLVLAWTNRHRRQGRFLFLMLIGVEVWIAGDLVAKLPTGPAVVRWAVVAQLVASAGAVLFLVLFVLTYTGRGDVVGSRLVGLLTIEPVVFGLLVLTDPVHRLVFRESLQGASVVDAAGPVLLAHIAYSYALVAVALVLAGERAARTEFVYRRQATALVVGVFAPFLGNALYFLGTVPVDLTPISFVVTGGLLTYATLRADFLELWPVARSVVLDTIGSGVLVIDRNGVVLDGNPQVGELLGLSDGATTGRPVTALLPDGEGVGERLTDDVPPDTGYGFELEVDDRILDVDVTPLRGSGDRPVGAVLVLQDITERERRRRELQRQRERLDRFAGVVSHDLRNPLNVAAGSVALAREECDSDHLETAAEAHDRMETLLEETLFLARRGETVGETEPVPLPETCERSWEMVRTGGATLTVEPVTVRGDRERLRHLFENLFRNAVEHAGTDATVRVGTVDGGFYVADDGPGIPAEERRSVFELGYSMTDGGTGVGLAIVDEIAEAHGWEVTVTDGRDGGARFEFAGVEVLDRPDP
jgi:PAS domain S-box-containing protein